LRIKLSEDLTLHNGHIPSFVHAKPSFGVSHALFEEQSGRPRDLKNRFITLMALTPVWMGARAARALYVRRGAKPRLLAQAGSRTKTKGSP
jgi:hypothetical protein